MNVSILFAASGFRWLALEEATRAIEASWRAAHSPRKGHRVEYLPEDRFDLRTLEALSRTARRFVVPFLSNRIMELLAVLRRSSARWVPLVVYTHTEGAGAGFDMRTLRGLLDSEDLFVSVSRAEARSFRLVVPGARVVVLPFPVTPAERRPPRARAGAPRLLYAARISEQKNLHTILFAYWLLRRRLGAACPPLAVYGSEDRLGNPFVGVPPVGYGRFVARLVDRLGLGSAVAFEGQRTSPRRYLAIYSKPHVLVSASLHAEEDFGLAVFHSLLAGGRAVLSGWGGHLDFGRRFPSRVALVPVRASETGPWVSAVDLSDALGKKLAALRSAAQPTDGAAAFARYEPATIASQLLRLVRRRPASRRRRLRFSARAVRLIERCEHAFAGRKMFDGYGDPEVTPFLEAYGMTRRTERRGRVSGILILVPWARQSKGWIVVDDPHRGRWRMPQHGSDPLEVHRIARGGTLRKTLIGRATVRRLLRTGYVVAVPR